MELWGVLRGGLLYFKKNTWSSHYIILSSPSLILMRCPWQHVMMSARVSSEGVSALSSVVTSRTTSGTYTDPERLRSDGGAQSLLSLPAANQNSSSCWNEHQQTRPAAAGLHLLLLRLLFICSHLWRCFYVNLFRNSQIIIIKSQQTRTEQFSVIRTETWTAQPVFGPRRFHTWNSGPNLNISLILTAVIWWCNCFKRFRLN